MHCADTEQSDCGTAWKLPWHSLQRYGNLLRLLPSEAALVCCCSGRKRKKGEINGKSANINNAMSLIYPASAGVDIPLTEASLLCCPRHA